MVMIGDALGVAPKDRSDLLQWSDDMVSALSRLRERRVDDPRRKRLAPYTLYASNVIADRRASEPQDDLMSVMVHAEVDGDTLDDDELVQESLLILVGGDETTRHVISGGMAQLLAHPDQRDKLRADRALLDSAVEEMLRWVTPIKNMARTVTADIEFQGRQMHAGADVAWRGRQALRHDRADDQQVAVEHAWRIQTDMIACGSRFRKPSRRSMRPSFPNVSTGFPVFASSA